MLPLLVGFSLGIGAILPVFANHQPIPTLAQCREMGNKITICHATSSESNPYVEITIACEAMYGANENAGHFDENGSPLNGHEDDFIPHEGQECNLVPSPSPTTSPSPTISPSPTVSPSPISSPEPSTQPEASPNPSPSVTPSASPTTSPSPQPSPTPSPNSGTPGTGGANSQDGKKTSLANDNLQCTQTTFDATMDVKENGNGVKDVLVTFVYGGSTKQARSNESGRAKVSFDQNGSGTLTASADGWNSQSMSLTMPICDNVHLDPNRQKNTGRGTGQVLGATTLADTGRGTYYLDATMLLIGTFLSSVSIYGFYTSSKK